MIVILPWENDDVDHKRLENPCVHSFVIDISKCVGGKRNRYLPLTKLWTNNSICRTEPRDNIMNWYDQSVEYLGTQPSPLRVSIW